MSRRRSREPESVLQLFVDPLFGAFGGFLFVFLMVLLTMQARVLSKEPEILTRSLPGARTGIAYQLVFSAREGLGSYRWKLVGGDLPEGLELSEEGVISGWPELDPKAGQEQTFKFQVQVDSPRMPEAHPDRKSLELTVQRTSGTRGTPIRQMRILSESELPAVVPGVAYGVRLAALGGLPPYHWNIAQGELPAGLNMTQDGYLEGTTSGESVGTHSFSVGVEDDQVERDDSNTAQKTFSLRIIAANAIQRLRILTYRLPDAVRNRPFTASCFADGGVPPYAWKVKNLPQGLAIQPESGVLSGRPVEEGEFDVELGVVDSVGAFSTREQLKLTVHPPGARIILFLYYFIGVLKFHGITLLLMLLVASGVGRFGAESSRQARRRNLLDFAKIFFMLTVACSIGSFVIEWLGWEERFGGLGIIAFFFLYFVPFFLTPIFGSLWSRWKNDPGQTHEVWLVTTILVISLLIVWLVGGL